MPTPRTKPKPSAAAADGYKRQIINSLKKIKKAIGCFPRKISVSYPHLRAPETPANFVCRFLLAKKKTTSINHHSLILILYFL